MRIVILGAAGMLGRKLTARLVADGKLQGREITSLILHDVVPASAPRDAGFPIAVRAGDIASPGEIKGALSGGADVIFHLAAIVSGEAEIDFDKGWRINLEGVHHLLEAARALPNVPRVVFTSSIAVFGAPFPDGGIPDDFFHTPLTSYGAQKSCGELMLSDYTRKGFVDGVGIRLPTICVRPGLPNKAASGFFSGIIREPLNGKEAVLPVSEDVMHWHASPRAAVGFMLRAGEIDGEALGPRRNLTMPGLPVTVAEQIASLRRVAGEAGETIRREPDALIGKIVAGWPRHFRAERSVSLGFTPDESFDAIIRAYIEDDLSVAV